MWQCADCGGIYHHEGGALNCEAAHDLAERLKKEAELAANKLAPLSLDDLLLRLYSLRAELKGVSAELERRGICGKCGIARVHGYCADCDRDAR